MDLPPQAPPPRLCDIQKKYPEQEYGFNLHAERGKGQFIGSVDPGSPADIAGLKTGDRILGVNQALIAEENHKTVVGRIKEDPLWCQLLVIEEGGEAWYKGRRIPLTYELPNIIHVGAESNSPSESRAMKSPASPPPPIYDVNPRSPSPPPAPTLPADPVMPQPSQPAPSLSHHSSNGDSAKPMPRLCRLAKATDAEEYGFNLHAEKGRGHFIGSVDAGSLSERSGLEGGQRIVGVNGTLIYPSTPHKDVVFMIKNDPMCAELLVASPEVDEWYRSRNEEFSFQYVEVARTQNTTSVPLPNSSPAQIPSSSPSGIARVSSNNDSMGHGEGRKRNGSEHEQGSEYSSAAETSSPGPDSITHYTANPGDTMVVLNIASQARGSSGGFNVDSFPSSDSSSCELSSVASSISEDENHSHSITVVSDRRGSETDTPSPRSTGDESVEHETVTNGHHSPSPATFSPPRHHSIKTAHEVENDSYSHKKEVIRSETVVNRTSQELDPMFRMSAAQMREQLSKKKKHDPKKDPLSLQQKYDIIRNL